MSGERELRVGAPRYGGRFATTDASLTLPFVLPGERVAVGAADEVLHVIESAADRVAPGCVHFGICGGCQYQMAAYPAQLTMKRTILEAVLRDGLRRESSAGDAQTQGTQTAAASMPPDLPPIVLHPGDPYGYRNRIRLQLRCVDGVFHAGYNRRGTTEFLPVTMCPIAAPALWQTATALVACANHAAAATDRTLAHWFAATSEMELFCDNTAQRVQLTLFCAPRLKAPAAGQPGHFAALFATLQAAMPQGMTLAGAGAEAFDPRTGPTGRTLATAGAAGMNYTVGEESYWIARGGFFQVNRTLVATLVELVCNGRSGRSGRSGRNGEVAWDLFAGVGLFSRVLARSFTRVTAVESNPAAVADLNAFFRRNRSEAAHRAVASTTLAFLEGAMLQRERPDLVVLDPPRAGVGVAACALLNRLAPRHIVYVSCDPVTLARDLQVLCRNYQIAALHLVDMFPQTFHLETVAVLEQIG